jgi:hypothetical protein
VVIDVAQVLAAPGIQIAPSERCASSKNGVRGRSCRSCQLNPFEHRLLLRHEGVIGAPEVRVCMQMAWASASASIASSSPMFHSWQQLLGAPCAKVGPAAICVASDCASASSVSRHAAR